MPVRSTDWTKEELIKLYELRKKGVSFRKIAEILNKKYAVHLKYNRMNWDEFFKDTDKYMTKLTSYIFNKWTETEMVQLDA